MGLWRTLCLQSNIEEVLLVLQVWRYTAVGGEPAVLRVKHLMSWRAKNTCSPIKAIQHNSSSLISYLIWRSKDTRFTFYFLSGCYLHDETLMMERFTDRWIQHYFSYHKCPPNRIITGRQAFGGVTRFDPRHFPLCIFMFLTFQIKKIKKCPMERKKHTGNVISCVWRCRSMDL